MTSRVSINVSLTPELERFVEARVSTGRYQSASEVVREGLRLLEERELAREAARTELQAKIAAGWADLEAGHVHDGEEVFRELEVRSTDRRRS